MVSSPEQVAANNHNPAAHTIQLGVNFTSAHPPSPVLPASSDLYHTAPMDASYGVKDWQAVSSSLPSAVPLVLVADRLAALIPC